MPDDEKTPLEMADERLRELEAKAGGELEGLSDKMDSSFWDLLKGFFMLLFGLQWESGESAIAQAGKKIQETLISDMQPFIGEDVHEAVKNIHTPDYDPTQGLKDLQAISDNLPFVGYIFRLIYLLLTASGLLKSSLSAAWEQATQTVYSAQRPSVMPYTEAINAMWRDPKYTDDVHDVMNRLGLPDKFQEMLVTASEVPLDITMLRDLLLREIISEDEHDRKLSRHHLSDENVQLLKKLYEVIPPVQDIIQMAVREVFSPEIIQEFGQMEGMPAEFESWAAKQGLNSFWARAYWAAHWRLPSIGQGFEMLQRRVIDRDQLDLLLRAADVMPYWRDKLTQISYVPLTRVDVRRMFALGVLNEEDVFNAYLDHGYNDANAELMTQFTIAYTQESEKELTKADILDLYKKNAIDEQTTKSMLMSLGYSEDSALLLMYRAQTEVFAANKKKQIGYIEKAFVAGKITESEALSRLGQMDIPSGEISYYINTWELEKQAKVRNLTLEQIKQFFVNRVITEEETRTELKELGYNDVDRERFISLFKKARAA